MRKTTDDLLETLLDRNAMELFIAVAEAKGVRELYVSKLNLTRKQFYGRMMKLRHAGLVERNGSTKYKLTSFGKVMHHIVEMITYADTNLKWKYEAIDGTEDLDIKQKLYENLFTQKDKELELVCVH